MENKKLFSKTKLKPSPVLLISSASRDSMQDFKVEISASGLQEQTTNGPSSISFDYDVKFSYTHSPPAIQFEREAETAVYKLKSAEDV